MQSIQGFYDGQKFIALEAIPSLNSSKVIITFIDDTEVQTIRNLTAQTDGFHFWNDEAEDIYASVLSKGLS